MAGQTKYYLVPVVDGIEPELRGPYATEEERDAAAKRIRAEEQSGEDNDDCLFRLDIDEKGEPTIDTYSGGFFDGDG